MIDKWSVQLRHKNPCSVPLRALIVDDSPANLDQLKRLIEKESSLICIGLTEPVRALDMAEAEQFDLVLVDYSMPVLDGIALTRHLRALSGYERLPIVMITANVDEQVRLQALEAGATDFLPKSSKAAETKARLRNMISLATAFRQLNDQAAWLAREVEIATSKLLQREEEIIFRLSLAVEYRDNDTGGHTFRVARYSEILAETLGLSPAACRSIFLAAPLHDVGKVAIPDAVLLKPSRLEPEEFEVIRTHAVIGERILGGSSSDLIKLASEIAGSHHERWDGKGYPAGLAGRLIPLAARIVAIADVFDALTTARPYKTAMTHEEAFAYLQKERGAHFDPACVDAFLAARAKILEAKSRSIQMEVSGVLSALTVTQAG
ncbi:cyclic di-GMP phosphodiesterase response regulator RpfG (plasmid) [Methylobacterium phyllosphaerae]|uniref:Cyclic di-GMP phosphodiesterase response regulator RpfG n=1 Tax=Methylobacterium phyllosphaerae TaxID=418223 RepID=A0AAE8L9N1_9HYPH|nr:HD domain-containing phosphohydrolase [Methylobacterium phyllosphaerae]APT35146.1 cyclic di-GMP phosphodiesterase response regulator RpfG [Methylobacterium phyllosphaerae]SFH68732.1 putative two-component system response regulator [Methylobacterium phyllosphaerae]